MTRAAVDRGGIVMGDYEAFLGNKRQLGGMNGFAPVWMPDFLFDFQKALVEWAVLKGRAALFADCVAGETMVDTERGAVRMEDLARAGKPVRVWACTRHGIELRQASAPWINGYAPLYELRFASGRTLRVTSGHRLLSASGDWVQVRNSRIGDRFLASSLDPAASSLERAQSALLSGAPNSSQTLPSYPARCSAYSRRGGERLLSAQECDQVLPPSLGGALERTPQQLRADGTACKSARSRPHQFAYRRAMPDYANPVVSGAAVVEYRPLSCGHTSPDGNSRTEPPIRGEIGRQRLVPESLPSGEREFVGVRFAALCNLHADTLVDVNYIRDDVFYDMEVPGVANYIANGLVSHNCGLGKTPMQLVWAENVVRKTGGRVLLLTPLAVSYQTEEEAAKFGIEAKRSHGELSANILIANYERLHHFNAADFVGCVCDESSILKNFDGKTKSAVTEFMRKLPYRLLATATAAPNDYIELGTSSEALGELGHMDMLGRFFKHVDNTSVARHDGFRFKHKEKATMLRETGSLWRFKGHAEVPFWKWVSSWSRALRRPSDLGFDDGRFELPPLQERDHLVDVERLPEGMLFALPAVGLKEQRDERRRSIEERCEKVASLVNGTGEPALVWCHLNDEGDLLERLIPDAIQVSGSDSDDTKEEKLLAFAHRQCRVLVTKPKIGAWGLNLQHCAHITFFPSHSYEQYYQGVRRCWRFGQKRPVQVDIITTEGEKSVLNNLQRKADAADKMFSALVSHMNDAITIERGHAFDRHEEMPQWL